MDSLLTDSLPLLANADLVLRCFEYWTSCVDERRDDQITLPLKELLLPLPEVLEYPLDCLAGNPSSKDEGGGRVHSAPPGVGYLLFNSLRHPGIKRKYEVLLLVI